MSPLLFAMFLNDVELELQAGSSSGISLDELNIYLLLFADDAVLFSETKEGLQTSLDNFEQYCKKWNLTVNTDKTKIMVFRKGGRLQADERWTIGGAEIEIVNHFNYLGIVFSSGGSFMKATKTLSGKAIKALGSLFSITNTLEVPINIMCNLFEAFVCSILNYGCEIWGFSKADDVEKVQRKFCKWVLGVKQTTNNLSVCGEMGRFPLFIERRIRCVKYWLRLLTEKTENCILSAVCERLMKQVERNKNHKNWVSDIKGLLQTSGFPDVWMYPRSVNINMFLPILRVRMRDVYISQWRDGMLSCTSLMLYREIHPQFQRAAYLDKLISPKLRRALSKLRLSSHILHIETGRHRSIPRNERICTLCNIGDVEDEYHFVMICPLYKEIRNMHIRRYYVNRPNMLKFVQLLKSENFNVLKSLSIYVIEALTVRESAINIRHV